MVRHGKRKSNGLCTQHPQFRHRHFRRRVRDDRRTCAVGRGQRALARAPLDFSKKFFQYFTRRTAPHGASQLHLFAEVNRLRRHGSHKLFVQHPCVCIFGSCIGIVFPSLGAGHFPRPFFIRSCFALLLDLPLVASSVARNKLLFRTALQNLKSCLWMLDYVWMGYLLLIFGTL